MEVLSYRKLLKQIVDGYTKYWDTPRVYCLVEYDLPLHENQKCRIRISMTIRGVKTVFFEHAMFTDAWSEEAIKEMLAFQAIKELSKHGIAEMWKHLCMRNRERVETERRLNDPVLMYPAIPSEMFKNDENE